MVEVGIRNPDMPRAGEDHLARPGPAHDESIEDEQVDEVEDEQHAEGAGEEFPKGVTSQSRGSPKQCRSNGSPEEQSQQERHPPLPLRLGRDDRPDLFRVMAQEQAGFEPQQEEQASRSDNGQQRSISHDPCGI